MDQVSALLSDRGRALLDRVGQLDGLTSDTALRVGTDLRQEYPAALVAAALSQHELRLRARAKFTRAVQMLFTRAGLEQASSETTSRHRAVRYDDVRHVADLCTGIGGDLIGLAGPRTVLAVDIDPVHLRLAAFNAEVYGVGQAVDRVAADVREVNLSGVDAVFIDPTRRAGARRRSAAHSEPPLEWCLNLAGRVPSVGIKTAPGLDTGLVPADWEIEFIAEGRNLKEASLWSPARATVRRRATVLPAGHTLVPQPGEPVSCSPPGAFLLDPNPAVTRAGLVEELARELDCWKIDPKIAFLSSDQEVHTPFARTLRVVDSGPWDLRRLTARLHELDIGAVDIRRRGLAGDVEQLRRRLKLRGRRRATLVMTRTDDKPWAVTCLEPGEPVGRGAVDSGRP